MFKIIVVLIQISVRFILVMKRIFLNKQVFRFIWVFGINDIVIKLSVSVLCVKIFNKVFVVKVCFVNLQMINVIVSVINLILIKIEMLNVREIVMFKMVVWVVVFLKQVMCCQIMKQFRILVVKVVLMFVSVVWIRKLLNISGCVYGDGGGCDYGYDCDYVYVDIVLRFCWFLC